MIDIENDVFQVVYNAIKAQFSTALVLSEYTDSPNSLPAVTVIEVDNRVYDRMRTENIENAVIVTYEINVFSDKVGGKMTEARKIMALADDTMLANGFTRIMKSQIPNLANNKIYRIAARYSAVVGPHGTNQFLIYHSL